MLKNVTLALLGLFLTSPAWAELPDIISDPATREVVEYLDSKVTQILTSTSGIRGPAGPMGPIGPTGATGATGATGPSGDAATISIGTTTTVSSTTLAQVYNTGTSSAAILGFILPVGPQGAQGIQGIQGPTGPAGTSDNLGNHIATQTIIAGYGINASTIVANTITSTGSIVQTSSHTQVCINGVCRTTWPEPNISNEYFLTPYASDVPPYLLMTSSPTVGIPASTRTFSNISGDIIVSEYITPPGFPGLTVINPGTWETHYWAALANTTGVKNVYGYTKIYKRTAGGVETLLLTTQQTQMSGTQPAQYTTYSSTGAFYLDATDRIKLEAHFTVNGTGSNPTVYVYRDNNYYSDMDFPATAATPAQYVTYTGATAQVNLGTYGLTTSSDVVAHAYYGDGSHLTGVSTSGGSISTAAYDGAPIGTFINYGSTIPPAGYLYCDGTSYSTTTYSALFGVIGYKFGGSGANFTCDFRGMFARGLDTTGTIDSEPRVIGSTETDKFQGHNTTIVDPGHVHTLNQPSATSGGSMIVNNLASSAGSGTLYTGIGNINSHTTGITATTPITDGTNGTPRTGSQTQPKNIAVAVMVKYGNPLVVNLSTIAIANTTNTFTGANTFTGSVTVSSLTVNSTTGLTISTFSATANGFTYLPGGLLMQWGSVSIAANSTSTFYFPKVFSNACYSLTATHGPQGAWQGYNVYVTGPGGVNIVSTSQFQISNLDESTITYYWQAIGN